MYAVFAITKTKPPFSAQHYERATKQEFNHESKPFPFGSGGAHPGPAAVSAPAWRTKRYPDCLPMHLLRHRYRYQRQQQQVATQRYPWMKPNRIYALRHAQGKCVRSPKTQRFRCHHSQLLRHPSLKTQTNKQQTNKQQTNKQTNKQTEVPEVAYIAQQLRGQGRLIAGGRCSSARRRHQLLLRPLTCHN